MSCDAGTRDAQPPNSSNVDVDVNGDGDENGDGNVEIQLPAATKYSVQRDGDAATSACVLRGFGPWWGRRVLDVVVAVLVAVAVHVKVNAHVNANVDSLPKGLGWGSNSRAGYA